MKIDLNGRHIHVECSVLTQDEEDQKVWEAFRKEKITSPDAVLVRPGEHCPENARGPSPYYESTRFYLKVFDKLAKGFDPRAAQFSDDHPNVLLISFTRPHRHGPGAGWALDELLISQPRIIHEADSPNSKVIGVTDKNEGPLSIPLESWVTVHAERLVQEGKLTPQWYGEHYNNLIATPRRLGAVFIFNDCKLIEARINYNSLPACRITHREMVALERIFSRKVPYWDMVWQRI